jgi:hypothetical protein
LRSRDRGTAITSGLPDLFISDPASFRRQILKDNHLWRRAQIRRRRRIFFQNFLLDN